MQKEIVIPKPCSENWNNMSTSEQGKFCQNCQKNVVDFTQKSDKEVLNILAKSKGNVCGRFTKQQLSTPFVDYAAPNRMSFGQRAAGVLLATSLFAVGAEAQTINKPIIQKDNATQKPENQPVANTYLRIKGKVVDVNNETFIYANVTVEGFKIGAQTDIDGNFNMIIPYSTFSAKQKSIKIAVNYMGCKPFSKEIDITNRQKDVQVECNIVALEQEYYVTGDIAIVKKRTVKDRVHDMLHGRKAGVIYKDEMK